MPMISSTQPSSVPFSISVRSSIAGPLRFSWYCVVPSTAIRYHRVVDHAMRQGSAGGGPLPVFQDRLSCGECVVDALAAAGGQLRGVLAVGQQRRSPLDGAAFCLGYGWPGLELEAVADRGGGSDEAGGEVRVAALQGQLAERAHAAGEAFEVIDAAVVTYRGG